MDGKLLALWDWLGQIPDPRDSSGRRYSLQSMLALLTAGLLDGKTSLRAISKWGRNLSRNQLALLNLRRNAPSQTTMHYLLVRLDPAELENALRNWVKGSFLEKTVPDVMARLRAKRAITDDYAVLHVLAAYCATVSQAVERAAEDLKPADLNTRLESIRAVLNLKTTDLNTHLDAVRDTLSEKTANLNTRLDAVRDALNEKAADLNTRLGSVRDALNEKAAGLNTRLESVRDTLNEKAADLNTQLGSVRERLKRIPAPGDLFPGHASSDA